MKICFTWGIGLSLIAVSSCAQDSEQDGSEAMYNRYLEFASYIKGGSIEPHWMADGSSFWYAEGGPGNTVIYKVDPEANTKTLLFDTARLRAALAFESRHEPPHEGLPFKEFSFVDGEESIRFNVEEKQFVLQLTTYSITTSPPLPENERRRLVPQLTHKAVYGWPDVDVLEVLSPDRRRFAGIRDHNLWLRSAQDGSSVQITIDGIPDYEWGERGQDADKWAWWSPNSQKLALKKEDWRRVVAVPIVRYLGRTEEVSWLRGARGSPVGLGPRTELFVVGTGVTGKVRIDTGDDSDQQIAPLGWHPDGSELFFLRMDPEFKRLDLMIANVETGASRVILTEAQETFVMAEEFYDAGLIGGWLQPFTLLEDGKRFVWASERDGWRQLYLYDTDGNLIRRLTAGSFPVVGGITVDERLGWVYFIAQAEKRPYDYHLYRVSLEGEGFSRLTEGSGQHDVQFAPSKKFFLDTHSNVDRAPVVELRAADGTLLQVLSRADSSALQDLHWSPPEEFVVKAADGETDLYGLLYKPYNFDATRKYPVINYIYAAPYSAVVPGTFTSNWLGVRAQAMAQLGFVTFIVDVRGTAHRGKAFQTVTYGNIGRYEILDHVATLEQLADERPYLDLNHVGVWGMSWGGYYAVRALLQAPDVFHVGIAVNPDVERYDHHGDLPYMGSPANNKAGYDYGSNIRLADNLQGKLLLIQSTSDAHGTFAWTMKLIEALIQKGKPYDLIVLPDEGHHPSGANLSYMQQAARRYFQEHLGSETGATR